MFQTRKTELLSHMTRLNPARETYGTDGGSMVWFVVLGIICSLTVAFIIFSRRRHTVFKRLNIPGPEPSTFLGIIPLIKEKGIAKTDLELVSKYGKIVGVYVGHRPVLLTSDASFIQQVCVKKFNCFKNRVSIMNLGCTLQSAVALTKDEHWEILRRRLAPLFCPGKLQKSGVLAIITESAQELVDHVKESLTANKNGFDFYKVCACFSMDVLCSSIFGCHGTSRNTSNEDLIRKVLAAFEAGNKNVVKPVTLCAIFPALRHWFQCRNYNPISKEIRQFFEDHMTREIEKRNNPKNRCDGLLQSMLESDSNSNSTGERKAANLELSISDLTANSLFFVLSGYETVANALGLTVLCLAVHPECQHELINEITTCLETTNSARYKEKLSHFEDIQKLKYLDHCVNESLRLFPPFLRFNRATNAESVINGMVVPKGVDVTVSVYALHHDPDVWIEPEKFDPDRFSEERFTTSHLSNFLPFGLGPRDCFGKDFAMLEVKIALVHLLLRYEVSPFPDTEFPPVLEKGNFSKSENGIRLKFSERMQW
ncbi:cytochrome P450 3A13-like isoform X2 [Ostrea edulis]|uniref:cytochrome P450 3A13-like isoform X2 n=1 Tax=Ostrea edulis TaxID=37623 RepID=UPI002095F18D|nr:cytochrome P450 3A13-like isoform X2 [Ostrea edulis]